MSDKNGQQKDSIVAKLLQKWKPYSASEVIQQENATSLYDEDGAIDLSSSKGRNFVQNDYPTLALPNIQDANSQHQNQYDGYSLQCTLCPFVAETTKALFKHYTYHQQFASNKSSNDYYKRTSQYGGSAGTTGIPKDNTETTIIHPVTNIATETDPSGLTLRDLLKKKEETKVHTSSYLHSVVKAVMNDKVGGYNPRTSISALGSPDAINVESSDVLNSVKRSSNVNFDPSGSNSSSNGNTSPNNESKSEVDAMPIPSKHSKGNSDGVHLTTNEVCLKKDLQDEGIAVSRESATFCPQPLEGFIIRDSKMAKQSKRKRKPFHLSERKYSNLVPDDHACHASVDSESDDEQIKKRQKRHSRHRPKELVQIPDSYTYHVDSKNDTLPSKEDKASQCQILEGSMNGSESKADHVITEAQEGPCGNREAHEGIPKCLSCEHCGISFSDEVLYSIHMGCHSLTDPFLCNVCGRQCKDKYGFYTHIMRGHTHN